MGHSYTLTVNSDRNAYACARSLVMERLPFDQTDLQASAVLDGRL